MNKAMFTKTTTPIIGVKHPSGHYEVLGTTVEYRLFGIVILRKKILLPTFYGAKTWNDFPYRF